LSDYLENVNMRTVKRIPSTAVYTYFQVKEFRFLVQVLRHEISSLYDYSSYCHLFFCHCCL